MHRTLVAVVAVLLALAACSGASASDDRDVVGGCALQPRARCPHVNLRGADLRRLDLHAIDLSGSDLTSADLTGADLRGAVLARAHLTKADLTGADLGGANLGGADLSGALLTGANLVGANLVGANRCGVVQSDGSADDSTCAPTTTTTRVANPRGVPPARITRFTLSPSCDVGVAGQQVIVHWGAAFAFRVSMTYDGNLAFTQDVFLGGSGDDGIPLACDGKPHTIRLDVLGVNGSTVSRQETVSGGRSTPPGG